MSELETVKNDEIEQVVVEQPVRKKPGPKSKAEKEAEAAAAAAKAAEDAEAEVEAKIEAATETVEAEVTEAEVTLQENVESSDIIEEAPVFVSDDIVVNESDETAAEVEIEIADDSSIVNSESAEASIDNTNEAATNNFKSYTLKSRGNIPLQMSPGIHSIAYYPPEIQIKSAPNENGYSRASAFIPGVGFKEGYVKL